MELGISNTGRNITLTIPGFLKDYLLGDGQRMKIDYHPQARVIVLSKKPDGRKVSSTYNGWMIAMKSDILPKWPAHGLIWWNEKDIDTTHDGKFLLKLPEVLPGAQPKRSSPKRPHERPGVHDRQRQNDRPEAMPWSLKFRLLGFTITITKEKQHG